MTKFILASASPRRRELMNILTDSFEVAVSDADEAAVDDSAPPHIYVQELALLKAAAAAKKVLKNKKAVIISADTIVVNNGKILGKPKDEEDAFKMLSALSGHEHEVYTGYCIMRIADAYTSCKSVMTRVKFRENDEEAIRAYIDTGEPMDKAGAYGIQGKGSLLIEEIHGDYFNVVGFPVSDIAKTLKTEFNINIM